MVFGRDLQEGWERFVIPVDHRSNLLRHLSMRGEGWVSWRGGNRVHVGLSGGSQYLDVP